MQSKFAAAIAQICDEKHIDPRVVLEAIEAALAAAYRKDYGHQDQKLRVVFDPQTGLINVYQQFDVVKEVANREFEKELADAKKIRKTAKVGESIEIEVTPKEYGRIAAQTAKQVIIQRVREAEREAIYNMYKDREGELLVAQVQRVERQGDAFIDLDKATVLLERMHQIPGERLHNGQRIKVLLEKVARNEKGPQIIISRNHPNLIKALLELEVPEVREGLVEVKGIAREAGVRTKLAVAAKEEGIDPVGACVGQKGVRIQAVTDELGRERIDVIEWVNDPVKFLINALAPAKVVSIELIKNEKLAKVYVTEDQRSLAIGKNGQNVRLASILTGWEIDIEDFVASTSGADVTPVIAEETMVQVADMPVTSTRDRSLPKPAVVVVEHEPTVIIRESAEGGEMPEKSKKVVKKAKKVIKAKATTKSKTTASKKTVVKKKKSVSKK
ncbi:MAG: transcription termination/antitermination protein NusA [Candidatus Abawacabacteria bacterium]|nr:transcription termination/antitermination protein NusA [Candidatus Abawacabacteria bacterium]